MTTIRIKKSPAFSLLATVLGHGWHELAPMRFDDKRSVLSLHVSLPGRRAALVSVSEHGGNIVAKIEGTLRPQDLNEIRSSMIRILDLERDLAEFYEALRGKRRYAWVETFGAGRILSSQTVWEDLAKTLLTTNTTWNVTKAMTSRLCTLGIKCADGSHAFPSPETIARKSIAEIETGVRAGYRTPYLHELATRIASGEADVESWRDPSIPSGELNKRLTSLKGFGPYAAGTMLRLLGRYDTLAIDTVGRDVFNVQLNGGQAATDAAIRSYYDGFGKWRGLVYWMDVMKVNLTANLRRVS